MTHNLRIATPATAGPALAFRDVTLGGTWPYDTVLDAANLELMPGELALLTLAPATSAPRSPT